MYNFLPVTHVSVFLSHILCSWPLKISMTYSCLTRCANAQPRRLFWACSKQTLPHGVQGDCTASSQRFHSVAGDCTARTSAICNFSATLWKRCGDAALVWQGFYIRWCHTWYCDRTYLYSLVTEVRESRTRVPSYTYALRVATLKVRDLTSMQVFVAEKCWYFVNMT